MKLKNLPSEFQKALPILEKIKAAGYEAYFVGGSVRDAILGRQIHDVDIATSSYPQETKQIFPKTVDIGIEHGTVLVLDGEAEYEITTFRTEEAYVDYRRPSSVNFVRSLEEDLKRRDFTVNAFALDEKAQVIDLFGGLSDLDNRCLRAVGEASERFNEDALRIMRGFRFVAVLDFELEEATLAAMKSHAPLLEKISIERSFIEFDKLLMADFWKKGLRGLVTSGAQNYLPGLKNKGDALLSLCQSVADDFRFSSSEQAWAYLLIHLDVQTAKEFLKKWKTSSHLQQQVDKLIAIYRLRQKGDLSIQDVYHYGKTLIKDVELLRQARGEAVDFERIEVLDATLVITSKHDIVVTGRTLMDHFDLQPGPALGELLNEVEAQIVAGQLANDETAILNFVKIRLADKERG